MKKEFKAPSVEARELCAQDELMSNLTSGENPAGLVVYDDKTAADGYKIWQGFKNN